MQKMKSTILLLSAIIISIQLKAQEKASVGGPKLPIEDCRELIEYRDTKLLQIWDKRGFA